MTAPMQGSGVTLVGTETLCGACERRPAVTSRNGVEVCARCAGWAAVMADELAREKAESAARRGHARAASLPRVRAVIERLESKGKVPSRRMRRAVGDSPRKEYDREYYRRNREKKLAQGAKRWKATTAKKDRRPIRTYRDTDGAT